MELQRVNRWTSLATDRRRGFGTRNDAPPRPPLDPHQLELLDPVRELPARRSQIPTLRRWLNQTGLSIRDFAHYVLGRDDRTLQRYLAGGRIPESQWVWLDRLEWVEVRGPLVLVAIRAGKVRDWRAWRLRELRRREKQEG